jgi:multicomponent Na+:H+ antiporter subunit D
MGGFLSKWFLVLGAFEGGSTWAAVVMAAAGLLTAGYLFPVVHRAFFRAGPEQVPTDDHAPSVTPSGTSTVATMTTTAPPRARRDADRRMVVPLVVTAALGLALGLGDLFGVFALAELVASSVFGGAG